MGILTEEVKAMLNEGYALTNEKNKLNARLTEVNKRLDQISIAAQTHFDGEEILVNSIHISLEFNPCFNVLAANKLKLMEAMKNDPDAVGVIGYHPSTFKAYMKERLVIDGELPYNGLVSQYNKPTLKFRRK